MCWAGSRRWRDWSAHARVTPPHTRHGAREHIAAPDLEFQLCIYLCSCRDSMTNDRGTPTRGLGIKCTRARNEQKISLAIIRLRVLRVFSPGRRGVLWVPGRQRRNFYGLWEKILTEGLHVLVKVFALIQLVFLAQEVGHGACDLCGGWQKSNW